MGMAALSLGIGRGCQSWDAAATRATPRAFKAPAALAAADPARPCADKVRTFYPVLSRAPRSRRRLDNIIFLEILTKYTELKRD